MAGSDVRDPTRHHLTRGLLAPGVGVKGFRDFNEQWSDAGENGQSADREQQQLKLKMLLLQSAKAKAILAAAAASKEEERSQLD